MNKYPITVYIVITIRFPRFLFVNFDGVLASVRVNITTIHIS